MGRAVSFAPQGDVRDGPKGRPAWIWVKQAVERVRNPADGKCREWLFSRVIRAPRSGNALQGRKTPGEVHSGKALPGAVDDRKQGFEEQQQPAARSADGVTAGGGGGERRPGEPGRKRQRLSGIGREPDGDLLFRPWNLGTGAQRSRKPGRTRGVRFPRSAAYTSGGADGTDNQRLTTRLVVGSEAGCTDMGPAGQLVGRREAVPQRPLERWRRRRTTEG